MVEASFLLLFSKLHTFSSKASSTDSAFQFSMMSKIVRITCKYKRSVLFSLMFSPTLLS